MSKISTLGRLSIVLVFCAPTLTFAKSKINNVGKITCEEMQAEQVRLGLIGQNLANAETTRTAAGGKFRPFKINACSKGACTGTLITEPLLKYLPDHPDADKNGYVAFPNVDTKAEFKTFNSTATKLKLLAAQKVCGSQVYEAKAGTSFAVRYKNPGSLSVKEDIINMDRKNRVTSWVRQDNKGTTTTIHFDEHGRVQPETTLE